MTNPLPSLKSKSAKQVDAEDNVESVRPARHEQDVAPNIKIEKFEVPPEYLEADNRLREIVSQNERNVPIYDFNIDWDDLQFFARLGWETDLRALRSSHKTCLVDELIRMTNVVVLELQAGTAEDREKLAVLAKDAAEKLASDGPTIEAQIDKLNRELAELNRNANQYAKRAEQAVEAKEKLKERTPKCIEHRHMLLVRHFNQSSLRKRQSVLRNLISKYEGLLNDSMDKIERIRLFTSTSGWPIQEELAAMMYAIAKANEQNILPVTQAVINRYDAWLRQIATELPTLKEELANVNAEVQRIEQEIDATLDYYGN
jgi:DNA repair exonuclease SbcCD ATPase subunit